MLVAMGDAHEELQETAAEARAAWPGIDLPESSFIEALAARIAGAADPAKALLRLKTADLYLACAAAEGVAGAAEALERNYFAGVDRAVTGVAPADEVRQTLRERLLMPRAGGAPGIATYAGEAPLASWLRACAVRAAGRIREAAGAGRRAQLDDDDLAALPDGSSDPEVTYFKATYSAEFREAFHLALASLTARERTLLKLQVIDGLTGAQLASSYGTSEPTMSRWLGKARAALLAETRRRLTEKLELTASQLDSLSGLVLSQLDVSLARVLLEEP